MTWEVKPVRKQSEGAELSVYRVQRWCQDGQQGAYEMAFVHEDKDLCQAVAQLLNWHEKYRSRVESL